MLSFDIACSRCCVWVSRGAASSDDLDSSDFTLVTLKISAIGFLFCVGQLLGCGCCTSEITGPQSFAGIKSYFLLPAKDLQQTARSRTNKRELTTGEKRSTSLRYANPNIISGFCKQKSNFDVVCHHFFSSSHPRTKPEPTDLCHTG